MREDRRAVARDEGEARDVGGCEHRCERFAHVRVPNRAKLRTA
jgi:hypothetical protein